MNRIAALMVAATIVSDSAAQALTEEYCKALPELIDLEAAALPHGADFVDFARRPSRSEGSPAVPDTQEQYLVLASLLEQVGECHSQGVVSGRNPSVARHYLRVAAELGNVNAAHLRASMMVFQPMSEDEPRIGIEMLRDELEAGSVFAAGKLGWAYHMGYGVPKDDRQAFEFFEIAASGGMTLWQFLLAHVYEQGYYGQPISPERSAYWRDFPNKVHLYTYDCAIATLYAGGLSFPERPALAASYSERCSG